MWHDNRHWRGRRGARARCSVGRALRAQSAGTDAPVARRANHREQGARAAGPLSTSASIRPATRRRARWIAPRRQRRGDAGCVGASMASIPSEATLLKSRSTSANGSPGSGRTRPPRPPPKNLVPSAAPLPPVDWPVGASRVDAGSRRGTTQFRLSSSSVAKPLVNGSCSGRALPTPMRRATPHLRRCARRCCSPRTPMRTSAVPPERFLRRGHPERGVGHPRQHRQRGGAARLQRAHDTAS